ncbi:MAG: GNAT family N-acetyltransferase [Truepera sp.]|nr:GNAT family N-acetyltransferase [Truepera sp.]
MMVRELNESDLPQLLALLRQLDQHPEYRTIAPESRSLDELRLELFDNPSYEAKPLVLVRNGVTCAYANLCSHHGEAFLEGPLLAEGVSPHEAEPLLAAIIELARSKYHYLDAFVGEANYRAQEALRLVGFEPFRTTYLYELPRQHQLPLTLHPGVRLELATEIELGTYRDLYRDTSDHWATRLAWDDEELLTRFDDPNVQLILAYLGSELVGHLELEFVPEEGLAEVAYFGVLPQARGQGVGRALLTRGLREAFADPAVELVMARAYDDERAACHALERLGFRLSHAVTALTLELT